MIFEILISLILIPNIEQHHHDVAQFLNLDYNQKIENLSNNQKEPQRIYNDLIDIKITANNAIAVDAGSGKVLYEKNPDEIKPIASITKLMTALVFSEYNPGWQKIIRMKSADRRNGGIVHLNSDEQLTVRDLFYTALIPSDNSSAAALPRVAGFSEEKFVNLMNQKAGQLGMNNSKFADPTGLDYGNVSTVKDLVILLETAIQNKDIQKTTQIGMYEYTARSEENERTVTIYNTNKLVSGYLDLIGGKTGSLEKAGNCLAVKIKGEQDQEIIIIVLGSHEHNDRFQDVKAIAEYVFTNYQWGTIDN